jgi:hypothetical protein
LNDLLGGLLTEVISRPKQVRGDAKRASMAMLNTTIIKSSASCISDCPLSLVVYYENRSAKPEILESFWADCEATSKIGPGECVNHLRGPGEHITIGSKVVRTWWV